MIWHILSKDWKLLRRATVGLTLANIAQRILLSRAEKIADANLLQLADVAGFIVLFATGVLIVAVVHQDKLPGLRQDWLVRPVNRRDLLLAKLLFVALLVQGPIFLAEVVQGLMAGLPLWPATAEGLSRNCWMLLAMDVPCLALGALTRSMAQAIGAALCAALGFIFVLGLYFLVVFHGGGPYIRVATVAWVARSAQTAWGLVAAVAVLVVQYRWRKTNRARWALAASAMIWILIDTTPARTAFAIEERLASHPAATTAVQISFDPGLGLTGTRLPNPDSTRFRMGIAERVAFLFIPLRISGVGNDGKLITDSTDVHLADSFGRAIDLDAFAGPREFLDGPEHEMIEVPEGGYNLIKNRPIRLSIDFSLTLLKGEQDSLPAVADDRWIPDLGRCTTQLDPGRTISLHCATPGRPPCSDWFLKDVRTGRRGPRQSPHIATAGFHGPFCWPDYSPYSVGIGGDPSYQFDLIFHLAGIVDEPHLGDARLVSLTYQPVAHFTRHVVIPDIRLGDWRPQ